MPTARWWPGQSVFMLVAAGLLLPAVIALAFQINIEQGDRRREAQDQTLAMSRDIVQMSDAEILTNVRMLHLLGGSNSLEAHEWPTFGRLLTFAAHGNPDWRAVVLRDADSGRVVAQAASAAASGPLRPLPDNLPRGPVIEGVYADGAFCPCVLVHLRAAHDPDLVLSLHLSPMALQRIVEGRAPEAAVVALVDREGRFVARSADYENRVGTPSTRYVRQAVAQGGEGFYEGVTYEGFPNYTAYFTSDLTGWSAHVAIDRSRIDAPRGRATAAIGIGVLAAIALAVALLAFAAHDMRGRRRDEQRLMQLQKSEAISQFTSMIVHDFRNLLALVEAGVSLIRRGTKEPHTLRTTDSLQKGVERGKRLVNQLLSFARNQSTEVKSVDLQVLLKGMEDLIRRLLGTNIAFTWSVDPDARLVRANPDQMEQALINLAVNARDAVNGSGEFAIEVTKEGTMAAIAATDSGPGVPRAMRSQIFDPFFSTKPGDEGSGLGLAQVAGAVLHAGGRVEVVDGAGGGARFVLYLPLE